MGNFTQHVFAEALVKTTPKIFIVPRSGYANRLQAIASTALMAEDLGSDWQVVWEPQDVAPANPCVVFDETFVKERILSIDELQESHGIDAREFPLYLNFSRKTNTLWLAGHDKGEQFFMPDMRGVIDSVMVENIVIIAGGKFTLEGGRTLSHFQAIEFMERRRVFYENLRFDLRIEQAANREVSVRPRFSSIHVRHSDRNHQAPWRGSTRRAILTLMERDQPESIFVASDTKSARSEWMDYLTRHGANAWTTDPESMDRSSSLATLGALLDWRLLSLSTSIVYFRESSFAEEAAVASGNWSNCIALPMARTRRLYVTALEYGRALATYPVRHGPLARHRREG